MQDGVTATQQDITWSKECTEHIDAICVLPDIYCTSTLLNETVNAETKLLPGIDGLFRTYNEKSEMALKAFNTAVVSTDVQPLKASRTPLTHDSRNSSIPHFFINPSVWTSMTVEIINQCDIVKKIIDQTDTLRNHMFQVDLSYKKWSP